MGATRPIQERIEEKMTKEQEYLQKAKQYAAQVRKLEQQKKAQDRKIRNHRLIQIGAEAEAVLKRPIEEADIERFRTFLHQQEQRGGYFTKAMAKKEAEAPAADRSLHIPEVPAEEVADVGEPRTR